jgi:hypothetical protein
LILVLEERLTLLAGFEWPVPSFEYGGRQYSDTGLGEVTGFYDWLRDAQGTLLGIRYSPLESAEFLLQALAGLAYVKGDPRESVEIYFGPISEPDAARSHDQGFQYSALFSNSQDRFALILGTEDLKRDDLDHIARIAFRLA